MNTLYLFYDLITGRITQAGSSQNPVPSLGEGMKTGIFVKDISMYVDLLTDTVEFKSISPISIDKTSILGNGTDKVICTGIPLNTLLMVQGVLITIDDGIFEFTTDTPGKYILMFDSIKHILLEVTIDAT